MMKKHLTKIISYVAVNLALALGAGNALAVPADPRPKTFAQPDGSIVTVKIRGDESFHFYLTEDDYLLVPKNGAFYYGVTDEHGNISASQLLASPAQKRSDAEKTFLLNINKTKMMKTLREQQQSANYSPMTKGPGLFPGTNFPSMGEQKAIVVLVEYQDTKFKLDDPYDYFFRMLNEEGFSDYSGTGSARDYFMANSSSQFVPEFDIFGPVTLKHNMSFYGGNDWWGNDQHPADMAIEACALLDDTVDFTEYDRDGDGYIDNVFIFYAGRGEASGGGADTVWPHSWQVTASTSDPYYFDGVRLDRYGCSNEWEGTRPDGVGTFVHEFSHVLGLPDLYATSYSGAFTPGAWSALDYGPYNNDGCTPPNYSAFERYSLSWLDPAVIHQPSNLSLSPIHTSNQAYIIPSASPNEFFLLENRQQEGWDAFIPGHGMLIWHVDYNDYTWNSNSVNNNSSHQYVDIEEADNVRSELTRDGDSFPGASNVTEFTSSSSPAMRFWTGEAPALPITDISETNEGLISFLVDGGISNLTGVEVKEPTEVTDLSFTISWSKDAYATKYLVNVFTLSEDSVRAYLKNWELEDVGLVNSITVDKLSPLTTYYVEVFAATPRHISDPSNVMTVTTSAPTFRSLAPQAIDATDVTDASFTANWTPLEGASSYILNVYTKGEWQRFSQNVDFKGGIGSLPEGWSTDTRLTYAVPEYCGSAVPALRLSDSAGTLQSALYDKDIDSFSFWHRGSGASQDGCFIKIYAYIAEEYVLVSEIPVNCAAGGEVNVITDFPAGTRRIMLQYFTNKTTAVAIDDVEVVYGEEQRVDSLYGYSSLNVGNVLSYQVTGLAALTEYFYSVTADNGDVKSLVSNEMSVTTEKIEGISDAASDRNITVSGESVMITALPNVDVRVFDSAGHLLMQGATDGSGRLCVRLQSSGVYLFTVGAVSKKIYIRK